MAVTIINGGKLTLH